MQKYVLVFQQTASGDQTWHRRLFAGEKPVDRGWHHSLGVPVVPTEADCRADVARSMKLGGRSVHRPVMRYWLQEGV